MPFGNSGRKGKLGRNTRKFDGSAIPKGLCLPAQGCEERAPWVPGRVVFNPNGVASGVKRRAATPLGLFVFRHVPQGSSFLATLGFEPESLWDTSPQFPQALRLDVKKE